MAGVKGQASPQSIQPMPQQQPQPIPQAAPVPMQMPAQQDEIDYDALAAEVLGEDVSAAPASEDEIDYDALAAEALGEAPVPKAKPNFKADVDKFLNANIAPEKPKEPSVMATRFGASFGVTNKEKMDYLKQYYGKDGVRENYGEIEVKRDGKFQPFDPASLELADIADFSRDVLEGTIQGASTVGGLFGGGPAGAAAGMVAGGAAGLAVGDAYQAYLGIPYDPARNPGQEYLQNVTLSKLFSGLGKRVDQYFADKAQGIARDKLKGAVDVAAEKAQDLKNLSDDMTKAGIIQKIGDTNITLMPSQVALNNPDELTKAAYLADEKQFQNFVLKQVDMIDDAFKSTFKAVAPQFGDTREVRLGSLAKEVLKREGKELGATRARALGMGGNTKVNLNTFTKALEELKGLGFDAQYVDEVVKPGGLARLGGARASASKVLKEVEPTVEDLVAKGFQPATAKAFISKVRDLRKLVAENTKGGVTKVDFRNLASNYNELKTTIDSLYSGNKMNADNNYRIGLLKLKNAMQADYDDAVGNILGGDAKEAYKAAASKYSKMKQLSESLADVAENDNMTAYSMANWLFKNEKSPASLERISQVREMLELSGKPEAWNNIAGNYLNMLVKDNSSLKGTQEVVRWDKVVKAINSLPESVAQQILPGKVMGYNKSGAETIKDLGKVWSAIQMGTPRLEGKPALDNRLVYDGLMAITTTIGKYRALADTFIRADKSNQLAEFLSSEGVEKAIGKMPKSQAKQVRDLVENYLARARAWDSIKFGDTLLQKQVETPLRD